MNDEIKLPKLPEDDVDQAKNFNPHDLVMHVEHVQMLLHGAIKAVRQQRGAPESDLLTKFFAALDQATALDSKQSQWSNKTVGSHHERVVAWAEVHRLRGLLAPQPHTPADPERWSSEHTLTVDGVTLTASGPQGSGKTRLLEHVQKLLADAPWMKRA